VGCVLGNFLEFTAANLGGPGVFICRDIPTPPAFGDWCCSWLSDIYGVLRHSAYLPTIRSD
jgi:hypothetical protein